MRRSRRGAFCIVSEGVADSLAREIAEAPEVLIVGIGTEAPATVRSRRSLFDWTSICTARATAPPPHSPPM